MLMLLLMLLLLLSCTTVVYYCMLLPVVRFCDSPHTFSLIVLSLVVTGAAVIFVSQLLFNCAHHLPVSADYLRLLSHVSYEERSSRRTTRAGRYALH